MKFSDNCFYGDTQMKLLETIFSALERVLNVALGLIIWVVMLGAASLAGLIAWFWFGVEDYGTVLRVGGTVVAAFAGAFVGWFLVHASPGFGD